MTFPGKTARTLTTWTRTEVSESPARYAKTDPDRPGTSRSARDISGRHLPRALPTSAEPGSPDDPICPDPALSVALQQRNRETSNAGETKTTVPSPEALNNVGGGGAMRHRSRKNIDDPSMTAGPTRNTNQLYRLFTGYVYISGPRVRRSARPALIQAAVAADRGPALLPAADRLRHQRFS